MIRIIKYPIYTGLFFGSLLSYSQQQTQVINNSKIYVSKDSKVIYPSKFVNADSGTLLNDGEIHFKGNLTNDGKIGTNNKGYIIFNGDKNQIIDGKDAIVAYDVLFNNSTDNKAFELNNKLRVLGTANFADGIVYVYPNPSKAALIFEKGSSAINVKNKSFVDGLVHKKGNEEFKFPVGNKELYRFAKISAPKNIVDEYTCDYFHENSNDKMTHSNKEGQIAIINNSEYWKVERKAGVSDIMLTLSWDEKTTQREIFEGDLRDVLRIVRWDENSNSWVDKGGVPDFDNKTITAAVKGYGVFTIARAENKSLDLDIYNAVILNGPDDYFEIGQLENYDSNTVEIYNRWGVKVFETQNYGNTKDNVFKGVSSGRVTMQQGEKLPAGTYYYIINCEYKGSNNQEHNFKKAGYLHLEHN